MIGAKEVWKKWETGKQTVVVKKKSVCCSCTSGLNSECCHPYRQTHAPSPVPCFGEHCKNCYVKGIYLCVLLLPLDTLISDTLACSMPLLQALTAYLPMLLPTSFGEVASCSTKFPLQILKELHLAWNPALCRGFGWLGSEVASRGSERPCSPLPADDNLSPAENLPQAPRKKAADLVSCQANYLLDLCEVLYLSEQVSYCRTLRGFAGFWGMFWVCSFPVSPFLTSEISPCAAQYPFFLLLNSDHTPSSA